MDLLSFIFVWLIKRIKILFSLDVPEERHPLPATINTIMKNTMNIKDLVPTTIYLFDEKQRVETIDIIIICIKG